MPRNDIVVEQKMNGMKSFEIYKQTHHVFVKEIKRDQDWKFDILGNVVNESTKVEIKWTTEYKYPDLWIIIA